MESIDIAVAVVVAAIAFYFGCGSLADGIRDGLRQIAEAIRHRKQ